ncbi:MAG: carboxylesterase/lipase family protein [Lachnospiraceae bacterium]
MDTTVVTNSGSIRGVETDQCIIYKGIPYARPPVGERRWKEPEDCMPWSGIYNADSFSAKCPQSEHAYGLYKKEFYENTEYLRESSEDCLYLNIWTPKEKKGRLPVAFYIHGGAFSGGYSSELEFDGAAYCSRDVILVTINYRLNLFGFLAHPWLSEESPKGISGNYGIFDQIKALTWVYENIEFFGGDASNITVFGQSAGCMSTQVLLSSELTKNMIAKVILQSGAMYKSDLLYMPDLAQALDIGIKIQDLSGAKDLKDLRSLRIEELNEIRDRFMEKAWQEGNGIVLVPNVDGYLLRDSVSEVFRQGKIKDIPIMIGTVASDIGGSPQQMERGEIGPLSQEAIDWCIHLKELGREPAYLYYFSHPLPGDDSGAFHSAELWYMFGTLDRCWRPMTQADQELSQEMLDDWTTFMKTGHPTTSGDWKPYRTTEPFVKEFY